MHFTLSSEIVAEMHWCPKKNCYVAIVEGCLQRACHACVASEGDELLKGKCGMLTVGAAVAATIKL